MLLLMNRKKSLREWIQHCTIASWNAHSIGKLMKQYARLERIREEKSSSSSSQETPETVMIVSAKLTRLNILSLWKTLPVGLSVGSVPVSSRQLCTGIFSSTP